jgi:outer membrane protein assembly factor BamD
MKLKKYLSLFLLLLLFVSCKGYNKVVKSDDYQRKFELADELYNLKQYMRSVTLYEQVYQKFPKTGEGELAYYRIGKAYYAEKDYYMAGYYLGAFSQRFPYSANAEETLFLSAMCSVSSSPEFTLDQNDTEIAINTLQQFIDKYPNSTLVDSCNHVMDRLRMKIQLKEYQGVKLYSKTENYRAAVTSAETFLADYPVSAKREEISYLLVENSFLLTKNSIESKKKERIDQTIKRYRNFVNEFPESKYKRRLNTISDDMERQKEIHKS